MKILFIIFIGLFSLNLQAVVTIPAVNNASNEVDLEPDENESSTNIEIMGGASGVGSCTSDLVVINSCERLGTRGACNLRTICPTTPLEIVIKSDNTNGKVVMVDPDDQAVSFTTINNYVAGQEYTVSIPWSTLCTELIGDAGCGTSVPYPNTVMGTSKVFKLGVDSTGDEIPDDVINVKIGVYGMPQISGLSLSNNVTINTGVADYSLFPGDEKAYLKDLSTVADFSAPGAATIVGLRGFFVETNCGVVSGTPDVVNNDSDSYLIDLNENKEVVDGRIDEGLNNGATYVVMFGFQDEAGNIGLYKDLAGACTVDQHSVQPREVYGLLEDNQNCFISTAAYGSPLNAKVKTFKKFRDEVLYKFSLGQKFVKFYYKNSPPLAQAIQENKFLKTVTRALLWPVWAVSTAVLYMGLMPFMFVVTMVLLSFVFLREKKSKKKSSEQNLLIFFLVFAGLSFSEKSFAQDDFFSTSGSRSKIKESAPNEPPYSGTENDEFSDLEKSSQESIESEEDYEPEIAAPAPTKNFNNVKESPEKWKPYQRVPDEKRLDELSEKGLFKITKKGEYLYNVDPSPQKSASSFKFGMASFPNLANPSSGVSFEQIYGDEKKPMLLVDYEWQFFQSFGKLGLKVGSGLMLASGKGQFSQPFTPPSTGVPTTDAMEKYNFYMFPNSIAAIYRLDIFNKQWIVPFGEVGIDYVTFIEARDDGADFKFGGSPHMHFAVGGSFLLDTLGKDMMAEIDRQYGVNHLWLTAEYRRLESMGGDFDFSDDIINGGIMVEF